jgi:acetylornithine deacetylase
VEREKELEEIPHPPFEISSDHPLVQTLASIVLTVTGRAPTFRGLPVFTDAALLQAAGIPAVLCGPGDIALAHSDDESVPLSDLELAAKIYAGAAIIACNTG